MNKFNMNERVVIKYHEQQGSIVDIRKSSTEKTRYSIKLDQSNFVWVYSEKDLRSLDRPDMIYDEEEKPKDEITVESLKGNLKISENFLDCFKRKPHNGKVNSTR